MKKRRYADGGLLDNVLDDARLRVSAEGGNAEGRKVGMGGRVGVSVPVGKDAEIEPYYQGPIGSSEAAKKAGQIGINFTKRFSRGGVVGKKHPRDFSK